MTLRLVALTDLERFPNPVPALARLCALACPGSVGIVLRDRSVAFRTRAELGRQLCGITAETGQLLLVSDRVDLALELGADGVHLPKAGLLPSQVERLRPGGLISGAHHDVEQLPAEELARYHFLLVSPAFEARKGRPALLGLGLSARLSVLRALAPRTQLLALGGVDASTVGQALAAGADGVAAIGAAHAADEQQVLVGTLGIGRS